MSITHDFVSPKSDGADASVVRPSDWNAAHALAAGYAVPQFVRKTGDSTSTSTSFADVPDLSFTVAANTNYHVRFCVFLITSATTEGYALSVNGPTGTYKVGGIAPTSAPAGAGNAAMHGAGSVADTAGLATTAGPGTGQPVMALVEATVQVGGSGGTLALRYRAETGGANSVTIQTNSIGELFVIP